MQNKNIFSWGWSKILVVFGFVIVSLLFLQDIFRLWQFQQQKDRIAAMIEETKEKIVFKAENTPPVNSLKQTRDVFEHEREDAFEKFEKSRNESLQKMEKMHEAFVEDQKRFDEAFEKMRQDFHEELPKNMVDDFEKNAAKIREAFDQ